MAPKVRDRIINGLIMTGSGIIVSVVTIWWANKKAVASNYKQEIETKLEQKLDEKIFSEYRNSHELEHQNIKNEFKTDIKDSEERIKDHFDSRLSDFKEFMIELSKK